ncbi:MAG TPA: endopeptidase La [Rickettsiales bacterium]|nr:endopeptidase La [Rickettsiales bacterium]
MENKQTYFLLPVRDLVVFPNSVTSILIGRKKSLNMIDESYKEGKLIFIVSQKNEVSESVKPNNIYSVGVLSKIIQKSDSQNGQKRIVVEGIKKAKLIKFIDNDKYFSAQVEEIKEEEIKKTKEKKIEDLKKIVFLKMKEILQFNEKFNEDIFATLEFFKSTSEIIFYASSFVSLSVEKKQELLEENDSFKAIKKFIEFLDVELSLVKIDKKINNAVERKFVKSQKKVYLNEKIKMIKKELGEDIDEDNEDDEEIIILKKKAKKLKLSEEAKQKIKEELKKMEGMMSFSSDYHVIRNYIDTLLSLPWGTKSELDTDLKKAENILNRDHYGLKEVKERILDFLAVYKRKQNLSGQIICLVGAPGVGKTSLAKSIAEALNRKYIKVSLGGVTDESEIRGHRKTYVAAMPGKIINAIKKAGTDNPLILLDEIDKLGNDYRGDPSSALLEVLDPEQNKKFGDHFLEVDYDLSNVMFITTANNVGNIPIPLIDRMEIIRISGYTEEEKLSIAKNHLITKELEIHGLKSNEFSIDDKSILEIIRKYTFEAGVRNLERELQKIIRKVTRKIIENPTVKKVNITTKNLHDYLGVEKFDYNKVNADDKVGVAVGLAYTDFGGDLLNIESLKFSGNGKLITTGKLGDVMKESAQAAFSYVRSIADNFDIKAKEFNKYDFHLHVPEGATPKDGPSAGVAITASLLSSMTGMKINKDVAMTGEISLTGKVMPIGGLKEKLLAALRGNIKTVIIPKANEKNLEDVPENVKKDLKIIPVDNLNDALKIIVKGYK